MLARVQATPRLLLLGGTAEAAALARAVVARFGDDLVVVNALAGRTEQPAALPGLVRRGGFGGAEGLADYLRAEAIDLLIDATHPFAARIARHARLAAERARIPRLVLGRPSWQRHPLDRWIEVPDLAAAARSVATFGQRCLLTVGAREIAAFAEVSGVHFVVRLIDPPRNPLPLVSYQVVLGRGPFALVGERALLQEHGIDVLVSKASGGSATEAKLIAAREAGLPVLMIERPPPEPGTRVETVEAALDWLAERMAPAPVPS